MPKSLLRIIYISTLFAEIGVALLDLDKIKWHTSDV